MTLRELNLKNRRIGEISHETVLESQEGLPRWIIDLENSFPWLDMNKKTSIRHMLGAFTMGEIEYMNCLTRRALVRNASGKEICGQ